MPTELQSSNQHHNLMKTLHKSEHLRFNMLHASSGSYAQAWVMFSVRSVNHRTPLGKVFLRFVRVASSKNILGLIMGRTALFCKSCFGKQKLCLCHLATHSSIEHMLCSQSPQTPRSLTARLRDTQLWLGIFFIAAFCKFLRFPDA